MVLAALALTPVAQATAVDVDLSASGIQFTQTGSTYTVTGQVGIAAIGSGQFEFTVKLEQYRNGALIDTLIDDTKSAEEDSAHRCSRMCDQSGCAQSCRLISFPTVLSGTCSVEVDCDPTGKWCACFAGNSIDVVDVLILGGDVFKLTITPGTNATDVDGSNNVYEVTF